MPRYVIEFQRSSDGTWELSGNSHSLGLGPLRRFEFASLEDAEIEAVRQAHAHPSISRYRARDTRLELGDATVTAQEWRPYMEQQVTPSGRAVRIYKRNRAWVVDTGGRDLPDIVSITPYLPSTLRALRHQHYEITQALAAGVNPQILASAISGWYMEHPNSREGEAVLAEGAAEMPDNNAYVAWGDYIYKMVPVRQSGTSKAVKLMRERVRVEVERVRVGLTQQASQEAASLIAQANQRAATIRAEAERERQAIAASQSNSIVFPRWLAGTPIKIGTGLSNAGHSFALSKVRLVITSCVHGDKQWPMNPERKAVEVSLWLPLDGKQEYVQLQEGSPDLPHVSTDSACLKIGETILEINSPERLLRFSGQVVRTLSVINLASLLRSNVDTWNPAVTALLPPPIKKWLDTYKTLSIQRDDEAARRALPPTDILERQEETWSVR